MPETCEEFRRSIDAAAQGLLRALHDGPKTAWDLKLELRIPHTLLHLALGRLLGEGRLTLRPEGFTLAVEPVRAAVHKTTSCAAADVAA